VLTVRANRHSACARMASFGTRNTDYHDLDFKVSHWGAHYPRLLELKKRFDPQGLFYGHHAVGSELWSSDGNCRVGA
jgi:FAD/FMN-containing dehydrogenase